MTQITATSGRATCSTISAEKCDIMADSKPFFQYSHPNIIPPTAFKIITFITSRGVRVARAMTIGRWPIPKISAAKIIANHIPVWVGYPSSVFLILKIIQVIRVIRNNLRRISSFIPP